MGRRSTGFGPDRLSHFDLLAWRMNLGVKIFPWEIKALMRLDAAWLNTQAATALPKPDPGKPAKKRKER